MRGRLRAHFGLRLLPWLFALFVAGLGSAGVDNWGHAGGVLAGTLCGVFLTPRQWPSDAATRRLAAASGALLAAISVGMFAAPALPLLGPAREGPMGIAAQLPIGWRRATTSHDQISYTNGLSTMWRSSVTLLARPNCHGAADLVRGAVAKELWRLADVGALRAVDVTDPRPVPRASGVRVTGTVLGEEGEARLEALCMERERGAMSVVVLQPIAERSTGLAERIARTVRWPAVPPRS